MPEGLLSRVASRNWAQASQRGDTKHERVGLKGIARPALEVVMSKSSDKPKKQQQKKKPQKTLKERRTEKRAAKKFGS
jgi:hypothetical protein